jgi:hypothetical protein
MRHLHYYLLNQKELLSVMVLWLYSVMDLFTESFHCNI